MGFPLEPESGRWWADGLAALVLAPCTTTESLPDAASKYLFGTLREAERKFIGQKGRLCRNFVQRPLAAPSQGQPPMIKRVSNGYEGHRARDTCHLACISATGVAGLSPRFGGATCQERCYERFLGRCSSTT